MTLDSLFRNTHTILRGGMPLLISLTPPMVLCGVRNGHLSVVLYLRQPIKDILNILYFFRPMLAYPVLRVWRYRCSQPEHIYPRSTSRLITYPSGGNVHSTIHRTGQPRYSTQEPALARS